MRRFVIWAAAAVGACVVLLGLGSLAGSGLVRRYINSHGPELVGREIYVGDLSLGCFTGSVEADSVVVYERDGTTPFATAHRVETNIALWHLLTGVYDLEHLRLIGLQVNVEQRDTLFNFTDMVDYVLGPDDEADDEGFPLVVRDLSLVHSQVHYRDVLVGSRFDMAGINLRVPGFDLRDLATRAGLSLDFVAGGRLVTEVEYDDRAGRYALDIRIEGFDMEGLLPYVRQYLLADDLDGVLDAHLRLRGSVRHALDFKLTGDAVVRDFSLEDMEGDDLLSCDSVCIGVAGVDLRRGSIALSHLTFHEPTLDITFADDMTDNFSRMIVPDSLLAADDAMAAAADGGAGVDDMGPLQLRIGDLRVVDGTFRYRDESLSGAPFVYCVKEVNLNAPQFSLTGVNNVRGKATLGRDGGFVVEYHGQIGDGRDMSLDLRATDIDLTDFSPYTYQMFGNEISDGRLTAVLLLRAVRGRLNGSLQLMADHPKVSRRSRRAHPEYNVPLRAAVRLLTDREGMCRMDFGFKGSVTDPRFTYKRAIFSALGRYLVSVMSRPSMRRGDSSVSSVDADYFEHFDVGDISLGGYEVDSIPPELMEEEW